MYIYIYLNQHDIVVFLSLISVKKMLGIDTGIVNIAEFSPRVPADLAAYVLRARDTLVQGQTNICPGSLFPS